MKRRKTMQRAVLLFPAILVLSAGYAFSAPPDNFTATMVTQGMSMPMAQMGDKTRVENPAVQGLVTISLPGRKKTLTMNTANKTYHEQAALDNAGQAPGIHEPDVVVEKKKKGTETIDGHPCIRYDVVLYRKNKSDRKYNSTVWEAQDLKGFPVKQEIMIPKNAINPAGGGKIVSQFKNIKLGAATGAMFEVPKGYKKVGSVEEVMGIGNIADMMKMMQKGKGSPGAK